MDIAKYENDIEDIERSRKAILKKPVLALVGVLSWSEVINPYHIWNSIFPVQSGHYWFVSAYVVLCLLFRIENFTIAIAWIAANGTSIGS